MAAGALALGLLAGCNQGNTLSVTGGEPVSYQCEQGKKVQVRYFSLSDESLKLYQAVSAGRQGLHPAPGRLGLRCPLYRRTRGRLVEQGG